VSARTSADGLENKLRSTSARPIGRNRAIHWREDPQAAIRFADYLIDRAESLSSFPELGMPYRKRTNVRRLLCKSYYIYYRVRRNEQTIEILDYWHAARREPPF
jgi:plasmid stabilization system protein ParE